MVTAILEYPFYWNRINISSLHPSEQIKEFVEMRIYEQFHKVLSAISIHQSAAFIRSMKMANANPAMKYAVAKSLPLY